MKTAVQFPKNNSFQPQNNKNVKISVHNFNLFYGEKQALFDISLDINEKEITALIVHLDVGNQRFYGQLIE